MIGAWGLTEAEAGTDVSGIKTTARSDGTGWRLSGSKIWIHNAPVADIGFVLARTDSADRYGGISFILTKLDTPGVTVRPLKQTRPMRG